MISRRISSKQYFTSLGLMLALVGVLATSGSAMAMGKKKPKPQPSPAPTHAPTPAPIPSSPSSERDARQIMQLVRYLMVNESKVIESGDYSPELLAQLSSEMHSCGLSFAGPLCLDSSFGTQELFDEPSFIETSDTFIFISLISTENQKAKFALAVEAEKNTKQAVVRAISILAAKKNVTNPEVIKNDYLLGRAIKIMEISTPENTLEFAASEIQGSPDFRKLYHFVQYIVNVDKQKKYLQSALDALRNQYQKINQSRSVAYQMALLNLLRASFSNERDFLITVSDELINSEDRDVSELSAITLAERDIKSGLVKSKVTGALKNPKWEMRQLAVYALDCVKETGQDKNLLIAMLLDSDSDVRAAAVTVVNRMSLDNDNLPVLEQFVRNSKWSVRLDGINLAGRINTPEATALILNGLVDSDSDVRAATVALVNRRQLEERELPILAQLANSSVTEGRILIAQYLGNIKAPGSITTLARLTRDSQWTVRQAAVFALGKNPSKDAMIAIILSLGDSDIDVRKAAIGQIDPRPLSDYEVPAFDKLASSSVLEGRLLSAQYLGKIPTPKSIVTLTRLSADKEWTVRQEAVNALGKNPSSDASIAIIGRLADSDNDVNKAAVAQLDKRTLTNRELQALSQMAKNPNEVGRRNAVRFTAKINTNESMALLCQMAGDSAWSVRLDAVKALSTVNSPVSTSTLITRMADNDSDVRSATTTALNARTFNEDHVDQLGDFLKNSSWETRQLAARYLGTTSSCKAMTLLKNRLLTEKDSDVMTEIRKSVQAIQGRNGSCQ